MKSFLKNKVTLTLALSFSMSPLFAEETKLSLVEYFSNNTNFTQQEFLKNITENKGVEPTQKVEESVLKNEAQEKDEIKLLTPTFATATETTFQIEQKKNLTLEEKHVENIPLTPEKEEKKAELDAFDKQTLLLIQAKNDRVEQDSKPERKLKKINESSYKKEANLNFEPNLHLQYNLLKYVLANNTLTKKEQAYILFALQEYERLFLEIERNPTEKYIVVNIPSFQLFGYENGNQLPVLESRVVTGKKEHRTPQDTINIVSLKFNPTWTPTPNMIKRSIERNGKINIDYLRSHDLYAYQGGNVVPYENLVYGERYTYQQPSGQNNALGVLKFETDSKENIYLHDTNQPHLFNYGYRARSSGCIRVQNYLDLASWLMFNNTNNKQGVKKEIFKHNTHYKRVQKTPVYTLYIPVVITKDSKVNLLNDVYKKVKI